MALPDEVHLGDSERLQAQRTRLPNEHRCLVQRDLTGLYCSRRAKDGLTGTSRAAILKRTDHQCIETAGSCIVSVFFFGASKGNASPVAARGSAKTMISQPRLAGSPKGADRIRLVSRGNPSIAFAARLQIPKGPSHPYPTCRTCVRSTCMARRGSSIGVIAIQNGGPSLLYRVDSRRPRVQRFSLVVVLGR
jgi:hypothetical protein